MVNAKTARPRIWQNRAYWLGACLGLAGLTFNVLPTGEWLHAKGPMNAGHATLACAACHKDAPGSARQQIQANLRYFLGLRGTPAEFGRLAVGNEACLACHERPNDRHPVYRFLEPRFAQAREHLRPQQCTACHAEHQGKRVTLAEIGYCVQCHKDTKPRKDPVEPPHADLIAQKNWDSCLGCHDFHGNHLGKPPKAIGAAIPPARLRAYFDGGPSPYGEGRRYHAKKEAPHG